MGNYQIVNGQRVYVDDSGHYCNPYQYGPGQQCPAGSPNVPRSGQQSGGGGMPRSTVATPKTGYQYRNPSARPPGTTVAQPGQSLVSHLPATAGFPIVNGKVQDPNTGLFVDPATGQPLSNQAGNPNVPQPGTEGYYGPGSPGYNAYDPMGYSNPQSPNYQGGMGPMTPYDMMQQGGGFLDPSDLANAFFNQMYDPMQADPYAQMQQMMPPSFFDDAFGQQQLFMQDMEGISGAFNVGRGRHHHGGRVGAWGSAYSHVPMEADPMDDFEVSGAFLKKLKGAYHYGAADINPARDRRNAHARAVAGYQAIVGAGMTYDEIVGHVCKDPDTGLLTDDFYR